MAKRRGIGRELRRSTIQRNKVRYMRNEYTSIKLMHLKFQKNVRVSDPGYDELRTHVLRGTKIGRVSCDKANSKSQRGGEALKMRDIKWLLLFLASIFRVYMSRILHVESALILCGIVCMSAQRAL